VRSTNQKILIQATTQEEFNEMEELLRDEETKKLVVGHF
jgi:hypothetical protein